MSKLIDLIGRLGQQSAQPIGFGALTGRVEVAPTMALICTISHYLGHERVVEKVETDYVDAFVFDVHVGVEDSAQDVLSGTLWGVNCVDLNREQMERLVSAGCDFVVIDPGTAPASVVGYPDLGTIVMLSEPVDRETASAMRTLQVDGSLNTSGVGPGDLGFDDLVELVKVGTSTGGIMLLRVESEIPRENLTALRDAGIDGVVVSVDEADLVNQLGKTIRELPPRRRPESRGLSPSAPRSEG